MSLREHAIPPLVWLAVAVIAISTSAILIRWSDAPPQIAAFYRVIFTMLLLAPVTVARHRPAIRSIRRRDGFVAGLAGVALAAHFAAWFESLSWTSVAASVTLVQAQPVFVAVGAWALLDERVSRRMGIGILIALVGVVILSFGGDTADASATPWPFWGNFLAVVGAFMAAVYILIGRSIRQRLAVLPYVTVVYVTCALGLFVFVVAAGFPLTGYAPHEWILFLGMAIGPGIFGHTVINWVLEDLESTVVGVALVGEPIGSTLLAAAFLGEIPGLLTILGGSAILTGIVLTARSRAVT